jgi:branched-chain amino acid transport system permease protein
MNFASTVWSRLNGPQEVGHGVVFWSALGIVSVLLPGYSLFASAFMLSNVAIFFAYVPMALGLCLLWGYGGILSFGQAAFFGISGYVYGLVAGNLAGAWGGTLLAALCGIAAAMTVAAVFGYFVFYGQVSAWIVPLLTLVLSLILETFMGQTAGYQWRVGSVLFGGYNGMTGIPSLKAGSLLFQGGSKELYLLVIALSLACYVGLRFLVNTRFGLAIAGSREDSERTRMLGYNVNLLQVQIFTLAAGLAGLSGVLYVSWGNYMNPAGMGLLAATLPVIWTSVGGRTSLLAVMTSTVALRWLADSLAVRGGEYAFLILGVLLLATMLFFPSGIIVSVTAMRRKTAPRMGTRPTNADIEGGSVN